MKIERILEKFKITRTNTENLCKPLEIEDYSVQPNENISPPKWHLAHSTWFFEQFILIQFDKNYEVFHEDFGFIFNSYYNNAGKRVLRPNRGLMSRPVVSEVLSYRKYVTKNIIALVENNPSDEILNLLQIGINHEEQHQELLAYDIKFILGNQPTFPSFETEMHLKEETHKSEFIQIKEGVYEIGHNNDNFCFDNELGFHKTYIQNTEIANKLITNGEFIEFMNADGYENFNLWHAEGWDFINQNNIKAPLYWYKIEGEWYYYNFNGLEKVNPNLPVIHCSYYEAYAFAEWKGMRLPTEFEWEIASEKLNHGQLWEWTSSAYLPYPNFEKAAGALGEYNGKFMVNQHVLRGSSIATSKDHSRKTYRNFFHTSSRWIFSGIRLAKK
ncbi:ergothioneine biosynthesis protein EgtB [Flavobacterium gelidilacus]|uniref:ergothioneine biosynthesis protein EgtB n=1 Tax=Flavobacterium gelidilacus TaxID=206041 RepID=UPI000555D705|nr:ergothioneine biosynthesis protein EgtB [Flavobacterium gelidilacus]